MDSGPTLILILRHAEKPGNPATDVDTDGIHLSTEGRIRAAALSIYIPAHFPKVDFLFASSQSRRSNRSVETISPFAEATGLAIDSSFAEAEYEKLAKALRTDPKYTSKTVLICWHHAHLSQLAAALGTKKPPAWPGRIFDRIWSIDYGEGTPLLHNNPQMLLYGDSSV